MEPTEEQTAQQRRIVQETQGDVNTMLGALDRLTARRISYDRLGLADDSILTDAAFDGTGITKADYRAAVLSIDAIFQLLTTGHGTNLEKFAR
jgi:hypothetical protein